MNAIIFGDGPLGTAMEAALGERGVPVRVLGRPSGDGHDPTAVGRPALVIEASRGPAVAANVATALTAGCRRFVIATTGWEGDRPAVEHALRSRAASAVAAPNFSLGAAVFARIVERATELMAPIDAFEPYLVEWHRRAKADRPSGTARDLASRIIARHPTKTRLAEETPAVAPPEVLELAVIRAGASPGMHLVGFDATGETIELRLTARDRSAYALGVMASIDWLNRRQRPAGLHRFDPVVDELLSPALAATA
jgi:4-hydroxy-tetrahydrodipicolinate reductase